MKNILKFAFIALAFVLIQSCTKDFEEINTNPNDPLIENANPGLILPKLLYQVGNRLTAGEGWGTGNIIAQLAATNNFTSTDRYEYGTHAGTWNLLYNNMRDANNLYAIGETRKNSALRGVALVLKTWMIANATDMWGDVPYSDALKGKEGVYQPTYDKQADIYKKMFADLDEAEKLLSEGGAIEGDIMFGGKLDKWRKLSNSLKLRYLMRTEKKWSELGIDGAKQIQSILDSKIFINSNADNGTINYIAGTDRWPLNKSRVGSFNEKRMSITIEKFLKDRKDPRMPILFRPVDNKDSKDYKGIPNGLKLETAANYNGGEKNQSRLGKMFREEEAAVKMVVIKHSEVMFLLAEAAEKGYVSGDAASFYKKGIEANMSFLGVKSGDIAQYVDQPSVSLDGGDKRAKIAGQKWLALFLVGNEAWYDYRRTGLPVLKPGPDAALTHLPYRVQYPTSEQSLNGENYKAVIAAQGADEINTKTWVLK